MESVKKGIPRFLKNKLFILLLLFTFTGCRQQDVNDYIELYKHTYSLKLYTYASSLNIECTNSFQEITDEQLSCFVHSLRSVNNIFNLCIENREFVYKCINDMISNANEEPTLRTIIIDAQTCGICKETIHYQDRIRYY